MKTAILALALLILPYSASAKTVDVVCRALDATSLFDSVKIKIEMPDNEGGNVAPGYWKKTQTVKITYGPKDNAVEETVNMKLIDDLTLKGSFEIGGPDADFGGSNVTLMYDYDNEEIVAIFRSSTDGPIGVEVKRCKAL